MRNIAIILAGGSGNRLGVGKPKQFVEVAGKTIIEYTIDAFERHPLIDEIAIVCKKEYISEMEAIVKTGSYRKVARILKGGKERYHSSLVAIEAYTDASSILLIHDGVRPLVSERIISSCIDALRSSEAAVVAVPATDTIIELAEDGSIARIPRRQLLRNAQTPQCFRRDVIAKAFDRALKDPSFFPTDDCSVVLKYLPEVPIRIVEGEEDNIKVTYKDDIERMQRILTSRTKPL